MITVPLARILGYQKRLVISHKRIFLMLQMCTNLCIYSYLVITVQVLSVQSFWQKIFWILFVQSAVLLGMHVALSI